MSLIFIRILSREGLVLWELEEVLNKLGYGVNDVLRERGKSIFCERNSICKVLGGVKKL